MSTSCIPPSTRILVVRLGAMGDIIHALPAVAALKHGYPGARLTWAVEPRWLPLLAANPHIDRTVPIDRHSPAGLAAAWRGLRAEPFDFAVDFQGLLKSAIAAAASDAPRIYGFDYGQVRERAAAVFYTRQVRAAAAHVVDRNLELAAAAGAAGPAEFPLPAGREEGELPAGDFVLASPLAGWKSKQWPMEFYGLVAARLKDAGIPLVLNGPPGAPFPRMEGAVRHESGIDGLIHATRRARAVIGVDSGPLHLAAALAKPGVAIFGPTDPARNGPYGGSLTVLRAPGAATSYKRRDSIDDSMRRILPEDVLDALAPALASTTPESR
jgi:heptosyltransferase-1